MPIRSDESFAVEAGKTGGAWDEVCLTVLRAMGRGRGFEVSTIFSSWRCAIAVVVVAERRSRRRRSWTRRGGRRKSSSCLTFDLEDKLVDDYLLVIVVLLDGIEGP